ncbi:MAG: hypothetical protein R3A79_16865 [Nannocystaceae bacterium]
MSGGARRGRAATRRLASASTLALLLAACSGDAEESASETASTSATATTATTTDATTTSSAGTSTTGDATEGTTDGPTTGDTTASTTTASTTATTTTGSTTTAASTGESDGSTTEDPGGNGCGGAEGRFFPDDAVWYQDVSDWPLDSESAAVISWLNDQGWGTGEMRVDFTIEVLDSDPDTEMRSFEPTNAFYTPDCDLQDMPVPVGGQIEGEEGYECTKDGDCHLIVVHPQSCQLFEMWRANIVGDTFYGGCLAVWDMTRVYGPKGRGEQCTSADAAGYPIAPLLFTADEVAAGNIDHAIRFILPNARIRSGVYVHPATHATKAASGPQQAPPYGARLRLRADYPLDSLPNDGARTVAKAMQRYGIVLADGGNIALTAKSDNHSVNSWDGLLTTHDLTDITPGDFEMVDGGERIDLTFDCVREP